jgi:hypothetical protein
MNTQTVITHAFALSIVLNIFLLLYIRAVQATKREIRDRMNRYPSATRNINLN